MNAVRAVLISDTKLDRQSAVRRAVSRHARIEVQLIICLHDWLHAPMLLHPELGDLAVVALTQGDRQLPRLMLNAARQPVLLPTIVTVGASDVFIVEPTRDGPFQGSTWVDVSLAGVDAALHHVLSAGMQPLSSLSVTEPVMSDVRLSVQQAVVLCLLAHGVSGRRTGRLLGISAKTVSSHKRRVMEKLAIDNLPDLIRTADHNRAALIAVAESVLGSELRSVIPARPPCIEPLRLTLRRAPDRPARRLNDNEADDGQAGC